jgi:hypothetical protein
MGEGGVPHRSPLFPAPAGGHAAFPVVVDARHLRRQRRGPFVDPTVDPTVEPVVNPGVEPTAVVDPGVEPERGGHGRGERARPQAERHTS